MRVAAPRWPKRGADMNALLMDAQPMQCKEECAFDMGQSGQNATAKVAQTKPSVEECALGMEQRSNNAAARDA